MKSPRSTRLSSTSPVWTWLAGAIGIGEITSIPTAPAIAEAYYQYDHERRTVLPLAHTPYERKV